MLLMLRKIFHNCYILTSLQKLLFKERESRPTATIGCIQTLFPLVLERIVIIKYFIDVLKLFNHLQFKLDSYRIKATKKNRKSSLGVVASLDKFKKALAVFEEVFTKCEGKSTQLGSEVKFGKMGFSESDVEGLCSGLLDVGLDIHDKTRVMKAYKDVMLSNRYCKEDQKVKELLTVQLFPQCSWVKEFLTSRTRKAIVRKSQQEKSEQIIPKLYELLHDVLLEDMDVANILRGENLTSYYLIRNNLIQPINIYPRVDFTLVKGVQVEWKFDSIKVKDKMTGIEQEVPISTKSACGELPKAENEFERQQQKTDEPFKIVCYCGSIPTLPQPTLYFLCIRTNYGNRHRSRSRSSSAEAMRRQNDFHDGDRPRRAADANRDIEHKKIYENFTIARLWCSESGEWTLEHTFIFEKRPCNMVDFVVATHQNKKTGNLKVFTRDRPYMFYFEIDLRGGRIAPLVHERKRIDQLCTKGRVPEHYSFLTRKNEKFYECSEWRGTKNTTLRGLRRGRGEQYFFERHYGDGAENTEMKEDDKDRVVMLSFENAQKLAVSSSYILFSVLLFRPFKPNPLRVLCMAVNLSRVSPLISLELEIKGGTCLEEVSTIPISVKNSLYLFVFNPTTAEYTLLALNRGDIIEIRSFGRDASFTKHVTSAIPDKSCRVRGVWQWDSIAEKLHYSALAMKRSKVQGPHLNMQQHVLVNMIFRL